MLIKANKTYRHESNPDEKVFHDTFLEQFPNWIDWERISLPMNEKGNPVGVLSEREAEIMLTTIQWLGSPVGQGFLRDCGFVKSELENSLK